MLRNLLTSALPEGGRYVKIGEASLYALIGFLVVFVGIAFLILIVWLVGKIISKSGNAPQPKVEKEPKQTKKKIEEPVKASVAENEEISEETLAVIMAALTAYYQKNNPKCEFTLKRIKRM